MAAFVMLVVNPAATEGFRAESFTPMLAGQIFRSADLLWLLAWRTETRRAVLCGMAGFALPTLDVADFPSVTKAGPFTPLLPPAQATR
ncbi:hypothetical protein [Nocardia sp. NPDC059239]|uniref:hypothetical protein n=1 Tax=Nocardia sp. NPDC059239 TaxID=3346785 RepID=UPI0036C0BD34